MRRDEGRTQVPVEKEGEETFFPPLLLPQPSISPTGGRGVGWSSSRDGSLGR